MMPDEVASVIANTQYDMAFRNTSMNEVFSKIEKKFDVKISLSDSKMNDCRITADFTDHSLADTMMLLSDILELEYVIKGNIVSVSGTGCK
jgi:ferric-dicitrate binding protein FerR (iron transport regulator)